MIQRAMVMMISPACRSASAAATAGVVLTTCMHAAAAQAHLAIKHRANTLHILCQPTGTARMVCEMPNPGGSGDFGAACSHSVCVSMRTCLSRRCQHPHGCHYSMSGSASRPVPLTPACAEQACAAHMQLGLVYAYVVLQVLRNIFGS